MPQVSMFSPSKAVSPAQKKIKTDGENSDSDLGTPRMPPHELEEPGRDAAVLPTEAMHTGGTWAQPPAVGQVTLEAIGSLMDEKLTNSVDRILGDLTRFKEDVRKELKALGLRISSTEEDMAKATSRMTVLENELAQLKLDRTNVQKQSPDKFSGRVENAILGNIPEGETFEAAQSWINDHCKQSGVALPAEMFFKTEYVGVVFAKYTCDGDRDKLISSIAALPIRQGSQKPQSMVSHRSTH